MNSRKNSRKTSIPVFKSTRLLDQLREQIRYLHYSLRTEEAYVYWVKKFIHFSALRHPRDMGQIEVQAFLTHLATRRKVSVAKWCADPVAGRNRHPHGARVAGP
jgi:hypothetical protein